MKFNLVDILQAHNSTLTSNLDQRYKAAMYARIIVQAERVRASKDFIRVQFNGSVPGWGLLSFLSPKSYISIAKRTAGQANNMQQAVLVAPGQDWIEVYTSEAWPGSSFMPFNEIYKPLETISSGKVDTKLKVPCLNPSLLSTRRTLSYARIREPRANSSQLHRSSCLPSAESSTS